MPQYSAAGLDRHSHPVGHTARFASCVSLTARMDLSRRRALCSATLKPPELRSRSRCIVIGSSSRRYRRSSISRSLAVARRFNASQTSVLISDCSTPSNGVAPGDATPSISNNSARPNGSRLLVTANRRAVAQRKASRRVGSFRAPVRKLLIAIRK